MSAFFGERDMSNWHIQRSVPIQPNIQNSKGGPNKLGHQKKHQLWPANSHENLVSIRAESDCVSTGVEMGPDCDRSTGFKRRCFSPTPMGELVNTIDASSTACMYFSMSCQCLATACHQAIFFFRFLLLMLSGIVGRAMVSG